MKNLGSVSKVELESFLNSFDVVFSDLDGVIKIPNGTPLHNSANCINALKNRGKKVAFISNNTLAPHELFRNGLEKFGIKDILKDDVITPIVAFIDYLNSINFDKKKEIYVLGTVNLKTELRNAGFNISPDPPTIIEETVASIFSNIKPNENIGAVILDIDLNASFIKMQKAVVYLQQEGVICLTGGNDKSLHIDKSFPLIIGPGSFRKPIIDCSGRTEIVGLGKPGVEYGKIVLKKFGIEDPDRVLFIGDSVPEDMGFAASVGFQKLLVLSGLTSPEDLENWRWFDNLKPNYYVESLGKLFELISTDSDL